MARRDHCPGRFWDVLGLVILAVLSGLITAADHGGSLSAVGIGIILGAAGLILEDVHFRGLTDKGERQLEDLVHRLSMYLVPVFFVLMGMRVELTAFARVEVLGLAALLTIAAVMGKQACGLGTLGRGLDRLSIAIGMTPRGEVGIIFANIGLGLSIAGQRVVDDGIFSAVMIMVILTTMATPPALKWSFGRRDRVHP